MGLYAAARAPYVAPERGSVGAARTPLALGARRWWTADSGHDQSATIAAWRDVLAGAELTASGGARPSYSATGCGGRPGVVFDGTAHYMTIAGSAALDAGTGLTVYAIAESTSTASDAAIVGRWDTVGANQLWLMQMHAGAALATGSANVSETGTNTNRFSIRTGTANQSDDPSSGAGAARGSMLHWDGATVTRYTGRLAGTGTACAGAKARDATAMEVGRLNATIFTAMGLRHLILFPRALTSAERTALWDWASADCGVP